MDDVRGAQFESHRPRLFRLAYGMLGSVAGAEDLVQEAWLRFERADDVANPAAWLHRVVSRLALDELKSARVRRETYVGEWLPEPLPDTHTHGLTPEMRVEQAEALSLATLAVLEQLSPLERAAFLLRAVFDLDYDEIARLLDRKPASIRQLVRRARAHLLSSRPRFEADRTAHLTLLATFAEAVQTGDLDSMKALLADGVRFTSDGGGKVAAAMNVLVGPDVVSRLVAGLYAKRHADQSEQPGFFNGQPAIEVRESGRLVSVLVFTVSEGRIARIDVIRNPDKLAHIY